MNPNRPRREAHAQVTTALQDVLAVADTIADIRVRLLQAAVATSAGRRDIELRGATLYCGLARKRLAGITAPGLRGRRAELERELDEVQDATAAAYRRSQTVRRAGVVVELAAVRAGKSARGPR